MATFAFGGEVDDEEDNHYNAPIQAAVDVVVDNISHHWKELGRRLRLPNRCITTIDEKFGGDPKACCREMLWEWRVRNGSGAIWNQLQKIVCDCGHKDVSEKMQKKCFFKEKDPVRQDPMDAATFRVLNDSISDTRLGFLMVLLQSPEDQCDKESKEKYEQRMDMRKKARALVDDITIKIQRGLLLDLEEINNKPMKLTCNTPGRELERENNNELMELNTAERELERENNRPGLSKDIVRNSRQKNDDSGIETSKSANRPLARVENNEPLNESVRVEERQNEDFSYSEASYQPGSEGESLGQVANPQQPSNITNIYSPGNTIINKGPGSVTNIYPPTNPTDEGYI